MTLIRPAPPTRSRFWCNCEFSLSDILSLTLPVSRHLQDVHVDFQDAETQITNVICVLKTRRVDFAHFDSIFPSACKRMNELDMPLVQPRVSQRQINRANPPAATPTELHRRTIYLPLDAVITDMQSRFSDETMSNFNDLAYFIPAVIARSTEVPVDFIDVTVLTRKVKSIAKKCVIKGNACWSQV